MVEHVGAAVLADVLGIVADQAVTLAGDAVLHLTRRRELEALLHAALGLQFGHFVSFATTRGGHLGTATAALLAGRFDSSTSWKGGAYMGVRAKNQLGRSAGVSANLACFGCRGRKVRLNMPPSQPEPWRRSSFGYLRMQYRSHLFSPRSMNRA